MTKNSKLNIAFLCMNDPLDKRSWSGITYYLGQALQRNVGNVHFLGPVKFPWLLDKAERGLAKLSRTLAGKEYVAKYGLLRSWYTSRFLKKKMGQGSYDCIVAPSASTELGYFKTDIPVIYVADTTFRLISNYYIWDFKDLHPFSRWEGERVEKKALDKSSLVIYSSTWAADSAVNDYHIPREKLAIMPLGANMDFSPPADLIYEKEKTPVLTLLYLAVEWERKGGAIAFRTMKYLHALGIPAKLIVCGCIPPNEFSDSQMEVIPFLNKNINDDHDKFIDLLSSVHFLILPTRADCSLLVACESNAYGVPAITAHTGGVPDLVLNGINGYCLPYEADGPEYGSLIAEIFNDKERYRALIASSRKRYEDALTWDRWTERFIELYRTRIV